MELSEPTGEAQSCGVRLGTGLCVSKMGSPARAAQPFVLRCRAAGRQQALQFHFLYERAIGARGKRVQTCYLTGVTGTPCGVLMSRFAKVMCAIGVCTTICVVLFLITTFVGSSPASTTPVSAAAQPAPARVVSDVKPTESAASAPDSTEAEPTFQPTHEVLAPVQLSKNAFKWKGQSIILDTIRMPVIMGNGALMGYLPYPGGNLRFEKMLDEHTATFEVLASDGEDVVSQGEIAVITADSNPPDSSKPWQVVVAAPMSGENGMGGPVTISAVRFAGYYVPPAKTSEDESTTKPAAGTVDPKPASDDQPSIESH